MQDAYPVLRSPPGYRVAESVPPYGAFARPERLVFPFQEPSPKYLPSQAELEHAARCVLAALYLAGAPRGFEVSRRRYPEVLRLIRSEATSLRSAARMLSRTGFPEESLALQTPGLLAWSEKQVLAGRVLTAACPEYPSGWRAKPGISSPPALWRRGALPPPPYIAIVGSRTVSSEIRRFARDVAREAIRLGYRVVSGAAPGCDRAAARGAVESEKLKVESRINECPTPNAQCPAPLVEILPCGLGVRHERFSGCVLSPFAPAEAFSSPNAMQRNALLYAMAEAAVVVHARFGEGGTWRGAVEAHRRRYGRLIARQDDTRAASALIALGAVPLASAEGLSPALVAETGQHRMDFE